MIFGGLYADTKYFLGGLCDAMRCDAMRCDDKIRLD